MSLRVAIVDDEGPARQRLLDLLEGEEGIGRVRAFADPREALGSLKRQDWDLVFLDVQMPAMTGVELVRRIGVERMPAVIFVTAYDRYALEAFDLHAVDYLLKPFDDERFREALERARKRLRWSDVSAIHESLAGLVEELAGGVEAREDPGKQPRRLPVVEDDVTHLVPVERIDYIEARGPYAEIHVGGEVYSLRERMHVLESRLDPGEFARIHRSTIARLDRIVALEPYFRGDVVARLRDGTRLKVSRSRREDLERQLGLPSG